MYLTRFRINTARADARRLLASPQSMHAAVMSSFSDLLPTASETSRVLWRIDRNAPAEVILFMVGPFQPDLTHLVEQAGWPAAAAAGRPGWSTYRYAPFLQRLAVGSTWGFRLTANPVHQIRRKEGEPTKRTAHIVPRYQLEWLVKRQGKSGFRILEKPREALLAERGDELQVVVRDQRDIDFRKRGESGRVTIKTATYDGRLEVTDAAAFRHTLTSGLGKAKAYGCGLMTLAPIK
jgi:CRISPR system Cascade subunit CasE